MATSPPDTEPIPVPSDEESAQERVPLWVALAAVLLGFVMGFLSTVIVELIGKAFGSSLADPTPAVRIASNFVFDFAFVGAALYFVVLRGWDHRIRFGYRRIPWRLGIGGVLAAGALYYIVTLAYSAAISVHGTDRLPTNLGFKTSTGAAVGLGVFVCVCAPICEEFFFRGFLFGILRQMRIEVAGRQLGPWVAAVIVGLLFGLAHTGSADPQFLIPLGFLGFVLCILRWRTRSLYPCMALHSLNNCIALGVNELAWGVGPIIGLCVGSLAVIALITGPFSRPRSVIQT
jgi:uncharacterized protein